MLVYCEMICLKLVIIDLRTTQLYPDCKYKVMEVQLSLGRESFQWSGITPVSPGFTEVYPWQAVHGTEAKISWMEGQQLDIVEVCAKVVYLGMQGVDHFLWFVQYNS